MSATSTGSRRGAIPAFLGMIGMSAIAGILVTAIVTPAIAVTGVAANNSIGLFENLPSYLQIGQLAQKTELFAKQGGQDVKFAEFYSQNRDELQWKDIPESAKQAAISAEDPRFYQHGGVDVLSAARAVVQNFIGGGIESGSSTITMQYVKNVKIQQAESMANPQEAQKAYADATAPKMSRKIQEMRLAIGLEKRYSKNQILQGYLNIANMGGTTYGVQAAAQRYFGKDAKDLTLRQMTAIIAIPQYPEAHRLDNPKNIPADTARSDYILSQMLKLKYIDKKTYDQAKAEKIEPNVQPQKTGCMNAVGNNAGYFCNYVQNVVLNDKAFGKTYAERQRNFVTKGYKIHTTLNLDLQDQAQKSLSNYVPATGRGLALGGTVVSVETGTGHIVAMAQNTQFNDTQEAANDPSQTAVNYNTDYAYGGSGGFNVGSTYKAFTLAAWVRAGHSVYDTVDASRMSYPASAFKDSCNHAQANYSFQNDGNERYGRISVLDATRFSVNSAFVAMASKLDLCNVRDAAQAMDVHTATGTPLQTNPASILGTNEMAPMTMATAFGGFANGGQVCTPIAIDSITLQDGTAVDAPKSKCTQGLDKDVAAQVDVALQGPPRNGTAAAANPHDGVPVLGKTGTADDHAQIWFVGSTTKLATAVWIGNVKQTNKRWVDIKRYGLYTARLAIYKQYASMTDSVYGGDAFPDVDKSTIKGSTATIPDLSGKSVSDAKQALQNLGFTVQQGNKVDSNQPEGSVASTNPTAGSPLVIGSAVTLNISNGSQATMPDLHGKTPDEAKALLQQAGIQNAQITQQDSNRRGQPGTISTSDPDAGEAVMKDSPQITIYVYK